MFPNKGSIEGANVYAQDEDSEEFDSEEEEINRIGNVPLEWYDEEDHIGYTIEGRKLIKTLRVSEIEKLIANANNPDFWKIIYDTKNNQKFQLTDRDIKILKRIKNNFFPSVSTLPEDSYVEFDNPEERIFSSINAPQPKSRFLPSRWEAKKITRLVKLIREGKIVRKKRKREEKKAFDLWGKAILEADIDQKDGRFRGPPSLPAPKLAMPSHNESFNPPDEYLFTEEEKKIWKEADVDDRGLTFLPHQYPCLRKVPVYKNLISERFERCLDLYLCPRALKLRMNVDPESLLPSLPSPGDLRPFPSNIRIEYQYLHYDKMSDQHIFPPIKAISVDPPGHWLAVGGDNFQVMIFEVLTGRMFHNFKFEKTITSLAWHPILPILAIGLEDDLLIVQVDLQNIIILPEDHKKDKNFDAANLLNLVNVLAVTEHDILAAKTHLGGESFLKSNSLNFPVGVWIPFAAISDHPKWKHLSNSGIVGGFVIHHDSNILQILWHQKGNYVSVICPDAATPAQQFSIHGINKRSTVKPIRRTQSGRIRDIAFHPSKPWIFIAFSNSVKLYDLKGSASTQKSSAKLDAGKSSRVTLVKKFLGVEGAKSISVHPSGEHFIIGGENRRLMWFDLGLGNKAFKILRYHERMINRVGFHSRYPLMFSASEDGSAFVFHSKVTEFNIKNPSIIPLKKLEVAQNYISEATTGVTACVWHPLLPWLFTAAKDGKIFLWS